MASCSDCGAEFSRFSLTGGLIDGRCVSCQQAHMARLGQLESERRDLEQQKAEVQLLRAQRMILTTETSHNLPVTDRLGIVTAECVIGMHLLKDAAMLFRDALGGRSKTMQKGLRDAREIALDELKAEAAALGADAVIGIDLDYSEIAGAGKSMLFLVVSGTAVKLDQQRSG